MTGQTRKIDRVITPMETTDGAKTSVALATIGENGPNGSYVHMGEPLPW